VVPVVGGDARVLRDPAHCEALSAWVIGAKTAAADTVRLLIGELTAYELA
jgi:hypothetical protein